MEVATAAVAVIWDDELYHWDREGSQEMQLGVERDRRRNRSDAG